MAFLRFSRDKRGVESFALVHAAANRRGKIRPRVLYWFRTPPDIRVGREPFDADVRCALEKQYPDITFDWRAIQETPIPSADADKWRERRRAERAAKHAARAEEESTEAIDGDTEADVSAGVDPEPVESAAVAASGATSPAAMTPMSETVPESAARGSDPNRKRRRRRRSGSGGRGNGATTSGAPEPASPPAGPEPSGD